MNMYPHWTIINPELYSKEDSKYAKFVLVYHSVYNVMTSLRAGALGWPCGMGRVGRGEGGSGWGTHVHPGWFMWMHGKNHHSVVK